MDQILKNKSFKIVTVIICIVCFLIPFGGLSAIAMHNNGGANTEEAPHSETPRSESPSSDEFGAEYEDSHESGANPNAMYEDAYEPYEKLYFVDVLDSGEVDIDLLEAYLRRKYNENISLENSESLINSQSLGVEKVRALMTQLEVSREGDGEGDNERLDTGKEAILAYGFVGQRRELSLILFDDAVEGPASEYLDEVLYDYTYVLEEKINRGTDNEPSDYDAEAIVYMITAYVSIMCIYFFVLLHSQSVANSIILEKSSKLMETMLVTVKPSDLIFGKLCANVTGGIIQMASWLVSLVLGLLAGGLVLLGNLNDDSLDMMTLVNMGTEYAGIELSMSNVWLAIILILLGLFLYCSLAAIGGAMANKQEDLASTNVIFTMIMIASFLVCLSCGGMEGMNQGTWLDWIPFTAVLVGPARILLGGVSILKAMIMILETVGVTVLATIIAGNLYKATILYRGNTLNPYVAIKNLLMRKDIV